MSRKNRFFTLLGTLVITASIHTVANATTSCDNCYTITGWIQDWASNNYENCYDYAQNLGSDYVDCLEQNEGEGYENDLSTLCGGIGPGCDLPGWQYDDELCISTKSNCDIGQGQACNDVCRNIITYGSGYCDLWCSICEEVLRRWEDLGCTPGETSCDNGEAWSWCSLEENFLGNEALCVSCIENANGSSGGGGDNPSSPCSAGYGQWYDMDNCYTPRPCNAGRYCDNPKGCYCDTGDWGDASNCCDACPSYTISAGETFTVGPTYTSANTTASHGATSRTDCRATATWRGTDTTGSYLKSVNMCPYTE